MKARVFFIMTFLLASVNVKASNAKDASPGAAHGSAQAQTSHGEAKSSKKSAAEAPPPAAEHAAAKTDEHAAKTDEHGTKADGHGDAHGDAKSVGPAARTDHYVHHWLPFPPFKAMNISSREPREMSASEGRVMVLVFLASWCVPCQQQIREFKKIEDAYRDRFTDFVYIFAHDTEADARGFSSVYKIGDNAMLASASVLETFHQPELPSFYVSDRYKWLILRRLNTNKQDIVDLENFLSVHTAF